MSMTAFMRGGEWPLLCEDAAGGYPSGWTIKVYEIGEEKSVGVVYPDKARQIQPRIWWHERIVKAALKPATSAPARPAMRPQLKAPTQAPDTPKRPQLRPRV